MLTLIKYQKIIINFKEKLQAETRILNILNNKKINFICLAGFMIVFSKKIY